MQVHHSILAERRPDVWDQRLKKKIRRRKFEEVGQAVRLVAFWSCDTLSESVVMLMEGFLVVTAVLEPHLLLRPAAAPES